MKNLRKFSRLSNSLNEMGMNVMGMKTTTSKQFPKSTKSRTNYNKVSLHLITTIGHDKLKQGHKTCKKI
jgi:hypothetical protein